ncbi:hypothetical protein H5410_058875 [Solanum commersonii]|uniref:Uncharacterized protein n=1 Tax=Solanum commersonii TaxID=4109 RepID=A0A9J5W0U6_SOLCO|nr:hypothetical protein H5410_058875 [Solanum commersonii]
MAVKTLPMDLVGPHGQNGPLSRSNDSRRRPYLWNQLALSSKMTHFQGQTIPGEDLTYGASWLSRPKRPIFKINRSIEHTLPIEPVGPYGQNDQFTKSNDPRGRKTPHFANFHLTYGASWPSRPKRPFFKFKRSQEQILSVEPVGPHDQNISFSRSNYPKAGKPPLPPIFKCYSSPYLLVIQNSDLIFAKILPERPLKPYLWSQLSFTGKSPIFKVKDPQSRPYIWIQLALMAKTAHFQGQMIPEADLTYGAIWPSWPKYPIFKVKRSPKQIIPGQTLRPYLWSQLSLTAKTSHFQGQTISRADLTYETIWPSRPKWPIFKTLPMELVGPPGQNVPFSRSNILQSGCPSRPKWPIFKVKQSSEKVNPPFCRFLCAIVHAFFGDPEFQPHFCKKFTLTSFKTLHMEPVVPHGHNVLFSRSNDLQSKHYLRSQLALTAKTTHFQGQKTYEEDLTYEPSRPLRPKPPIFKVNRSPDSPSFLVIQNFDLISAKILHVRPLRAYVWSQLALTFKMTHFQGQTISRTLPMEPVGPHDQNRTFSRSNDSQRRASWPSRPKRPIFKVKQSPEHNYDLIFAKNLPRRSFTPYLWIQLALNTKTAHFQDQMIPEIAIIHGFFGDLEFQPRFYKIFTWMSVKTLPIDPVSFHDQNGPFSRSNIQQSTYASFLVIRNFDLIFAKMYLDVREDITYGTGWPSQPKRPIFKVKRPPKEVIRNFDLLLAKIVPRSPLRPYIWNQLALITKMAHFQGQTIHRADLYGASSPTAKMTYFQGQTIPRAGKPPILPIFNFDLIYVKIVLGSPLRTYLWRQLAFTAKTIHFQGQMNPKAVHGFFGDQELRPHFCKNFSRTSVKTLPMELVGPHGQNGPFSRSNKPRSKPYLWSQLALTAKTAHFQGHMIPGADLTYGSSWPSWPKRPIFKVKRSPKQNFIIIFAKILHERPLRPYLRSHLALTTKMAHFQGQTIPEAGKPPILPIVMCYSPWIFVIRNSTSFLKIIPDKRVKTLPMEPVVPHGQNIPFSRSNDLQSGPKRPIFKVKRSSEKVNPPFCRFSCAIIHGFFVDPEFRPHFCKKFTLTSFKTFHMEPVVPHGHNVLFSRSYDLQSKFRSNFCQNFIWTTVKTLSVESIGPHRQKGLFSRSNDPQSSQNDPFSRSNDPWSRETPSLCRFSCAIVHGFFSDLEFRSHICESFTWMSVKALPMERVGPHSQNGPFSRSNDPRVGKPPLLSIFMCYSSPSFLVIQNSDLIFAKIIPGRPIRPYLCRKLTLTAKTAHFQGQTIPRAGKPPLNFDPIFAKIIPGRPIRPYLCSKLTLTAKTAHFQGQTIPRAAGQNGPFSRSNDPRRRPYLWSQLTLTAKTSHFQGQTILEQILPMEPVGPHGQNNAFSRSNEPQSNRLALTAKTTHFQGQTIPRADLSYGVSWPSRSKHLIFKVKRPPEQTLAMESIGPQSQNNPFSRSNEPREDLRYGASWPSRPERPIFKVKRSPKQFAIFLVIRNSDLIFAKNLHGRPLRHLAMDPFGPHGQNSPFSKSNDPRTSSTSFSVIQNSDLIFAKTFCGHPLPMELVGPHGQNSPFSRSNDPQNVRQDLTYGVSWPSWPKRPISKVKQAPEQTLAMELVVPHGQNVPLSRSNDLQSRILTLILPKFYMDVRLDLSYGTSVETKAGKRTGFWPVRSGFDPIPVPIFIRLIRSGKNRFRSGKNRFRSGKNRFRSGSTEELDEEVEINEEDDETPTPTSPATELPEQDEVPSLPTFSKTSMRVKRSLVWKFLVQNEEKLHYLHEMGMGRLRTHLRKCNKEFAHLDDIERANRNGIPISENSMGVGGSNMVQSVLNMTNPASRSTHRTYSKEKIVEN